jgi:hypothetical protein
MKTSGTGITAICVVPGRRQVTGTTLALIGVALSGCDPPWVDPGEPCPPAPVPIFSETFSDGSNEGAWRLSQRSIIEASGGDPGAFLRDASLDTFAPLARTQWQAPSLFTGEYRAQGVVALAASFQIFSATWTVEDRPMSLMLVSDPDTPHDSTDDTSAFYVGHDNIPSPGAGWARYHFEVPSHSLTLPFPRSQTEGEPGWVVAEGDIFTPAKDPDAAWNTVMEDVDQVIFWFHDPRYFAIFQMWDVGMDNPSIFACPDTCSPG